MSRKSSNKSKLGQWNLFLSVFSYLPPLLPSTRPCPIKDFYDLCLLKLYFYFALSFLVHRFLAQPDDFISVHNVCPASPYTLHSTNTHTHTHTAIVYVCVLGRDPWQAACSACFSGCAFNVRSCFGGVCGICTLHLT